MDYGQPIEDFAYGDHPTVLLIGDRAADLEGARTAIAQAGQRIVGTAGFAGAAAALATRNGPDVLMIETGGAAPDLLADTLPVIAAVAQDRGTDIVVAMAGDAIDTVTAALFGPGVQHLCDAGIVDRIAALGLAGGARGLRLHDSARDADDRLRRLNVEVARFADTLSRLATEGDMPRYGGGVRDAAPAFRGEPPGPPPAVDSLTVRDAIRARRMRAAYFAADLFADPAWDMLLDLFAAELEGRRVSVSSLCIAADVPGTTALRWIGAMTESGLFERYADPADRRRAFISLSGEARAGMMRYFDAVSRARLMPA